MSEFNEDVLTKIVNQNVHLTTTDNTSFELTVTEVKKNSMDGEEWESFCVYLSGDESFRLPQGTYNISHDDFGEVKSFISPKSETEYEIIVNRKR